MAMTKGKVDQFVDLLSKKHSTMPEEKQQKAMRAFEQIPLSKKHIAQLAEMGDTVFAEAVENKKTQRFEDAGVALEDAVKNGVTSVEELCEWLGLPADSDTNTIIDQSHVYMRIGVRGRPETVSDF